MNWSRGFLRIWLIFSVVWFGSITYWHLADGLLPPVEQPINFTSSSVTFEIKDGHPNACYQMHCIRFYRELHDSTGTQPSKVYEAAVVELQKSIALENAQKRYNHNDSRFWLQASITVPAFLLGVGMILGWAFRGFKSGGAA